jgi:protein O-GlcNAc transferase
LQPDLVEAWVGQGNLLKARKRLREANTAYNRALRLKADLAEAWVGYGDALFQLGQHQAASEAFGRAISLTPDLVEAWIGSGDVLFALKQHEAALEAYGKVLAFRPDLHHAAAAYLLCKLYLCDWVSLEDVIAQVLAIMRDPKSSGAFPLSAISYSAADQLAFARRYIQAQPSFPCVWRGEVYAHDRIRVAYLSGDFRQHAVGYVLAELFELHDRSRFEVTGISFGPDDNSTVRQRIQNAFEYFVDVRHEEDQEIADLVRRLEIDIVVDLMGLTVNNHLSVLARRPAPIQVNYLGYAGTLGADYIDYIVADSTVIPVDHAGFFSEKVVWLPDSFMVTDGGQRIAEEAPAPTRSECGLPENAFVFCCFNEPYKILPEMFEIWMQLLIATRNGVLWLKSCNGAAMANLRREAGARGVAPERIIFAPVLPALSDHLARHQQADLFLDTLPYNAHSSASAALGTGLPVVTCLGAAFPGRVAASLLKAAGVGELITCSLEEYKALAVKLAHDPSLLGSFKHRLIHNRDSCALFDTDRFRRHIERAYTTMVNIHRRGESPRSFSVPPVW